MIVIMLGLYCAYFAEAWRSRYFDSLVHGASLIIWYTLVGIQIAMEFVLSGSLLFFLYRRRSAFKHSNSIVKRIVAVTMGTGLITIFFGLSLVVVVYASRLQFRELFLTPIM